MSERKRGDGLSIEVEPAAAGRRLDIWLVGRMAALSRSRLKALIEADHVQIGGRTITEPSYRVKPRDIVQIEIPAPEPARPEAQALPLTVVYEDAHLIVVDKPPGLVVHPAPGNPDRTLVNALLAHCGAELAGIGGERRPGIVHRLDKDTSGLLVAAKTEPAHQALSALFARHDIERSYQAVVWGVPAPAAGTVDRPIGRDPHNRKRMAVVARGRPARTRYRVRRDFGIAALVECRLETGRTHQIRVHMAAIGHPVLGDPVYARAPQRRIRALPAELATALAGFGRQALHAGHLAFRHPATGAQVTFDTDPPTDFMQLIRILEQVKKPLNT